MLTLAATTANMYRVLYASTALGLTIDPAVLQRIKKTTCPTTLDNFKFTLRDFQAEGVAYLEQHDGRCLLADDMGLGKTVQVMAYAHKCKKMPMLVICLNSLKFNWRNEICAMTGTQYRINIVGKKYSQAAIARFKQRYPNVDYSVEPQAGYDIYICNFNCMHKLVDQLIALDLKYVAIDESHKIKNPDAQRTAAVLKLVNGEQTVKRNGKRKTEKVGPGVFSVTFISGTPFVNRPRELWTTVNTVGRHLKEFSTFGKFAFRFCGPQQNRHGTTFDGATNLDQLHQLLSNNIMLRRLKADVLRELPPKQYVNIALDFDRKDYDTAEAAFDGKVNWTRGIEAMIELGATAPKSNIEIVAVQKLREIAARAKMPAAVDWIREYTEDGNKLVVFAHNRDVVDYIVNELEKIEEYKNNVGKIYGGISDEDRDQVQYRFQNDAAMTVVVVGNQAGGVGLTLTAAQGMAIVQLPWTAGDLQQMSDRIYRIGQKGSSVSIYNLVAADTIEEDFANIIVRKGVVMDAALDNGRKVNQVDIRLDR